MDTKIAKQREDEYFARVEFDRVKKIADENAAKMKQQELDELRKLHWMRCPKDGMELIEIEFMGVKVDKCTHCGGIFLDAGELDHLIEAHQKEKDLFERILGVFR